MKNSESASAIVDALNSSNSAGGTPQSPNVEISERSQLKISNSRTALRRNESNDSFDISSPNPSFSLDSC